MLRKVDSCPYSVYLFDCTFLHVQYIERKSKVKDTAMLSSKTWQQAKFDNKRNLTISKTKQ